MNRPVAHIPFRVLAIVLLGVVVLAATSVRADAHTELRASSPEEGATVAQLGELRLEFTGELLEIGTELTLVDSRGGEIDLEPAFPSTNVVTSRTDQEPAAGPVELRWRVVAEDGHPIEGVLAFDYAPPHQPSPEPSPTAATSQATPSAEPAPASATPEPTDVVATSSTTSTPWWIWPALAAAALVGAGVAVAAGKRRR